VSAFPVRPVRSLIGQARRAAFLLLVRRGEVTRGSAAAGRTSRRSDGVSSPSPDVASRPVASHPRRIARAFPTARTTTTPAVRHTRTMYGRCVSVDASDPTRPASGAVRQVLRASWPPSSGPHGRGGRGAQAGTEAHKQERRRPNRDCETSAHHRVHSRIHITSISRKRHISSKRKPFKIPIPRTGYRTGFRENRRTSSKESKISPPWPQPTSLLAPFLLP
jgi:hypothetical protein